MTTTDKPLSGQVALVTGASRGIGLAIAEALAQAGAAVWLAATSADRLEEGRTQLAALGYEVKSQQLDVADRSACFALAARIAREEGRLDILVNSAGVHKSAPFLDYSLDDFAWMMSINVYGTINMMQACLPLMKGAQYGRVINLASTAGKWGSLNQSAYNVSKHAVVGLTRCVALEMAAEGITVNAICPGLTQTEMLDTFWSGHAASRDTAESAVQAQIMARVPVRRLLAPSEIAALALFLASPVSGGMTGQSILHDGGMVLV